MGQASFRIDYRQRADLLRAQVSGINGSLQTTLAYWQEIAGEVRRRRPRAVLVVDDMEGEPPPPEDLQTFVSAMAGQGFEGVRVAFVEAHAEQIAQVELAEIFAREAGFDVRVFGNEIEAARWLRYGNG